jgi:hypothetical protein
MLTSPRFAIALALFSTPFLGLTSSTASAQTGLIGVAYSPGNVVFEIDPVTAETTEIGTLSIGFGQSIGSLSQAPDGFLYGITHTPSFIYRINPSTFATTLISSTVGLFEGGLAIGPDGSAYAVNGGNSSAASLYRIELDTGAFTLVGTMSGGERDLCGLALRDDGMLIGVDRVSNSLVEIDPVTAVVTELAVIPGDVGAIAGLCRSESSWFLATGGTFEIPSGSNELYEVTDPYTGAMTAISTFSGDVNAGGFGALSALSYGLVGTPYCAVEPNSLGLPAQIFGTGSDAAATNDLTLWATDLPLSSSAIFLASSTSGFVANPGGSSGNLCLGGLIGRFVAAGSIRNSGPTGSVSLTIDLQAIPTALGNVSVGSGDTYFFQTWYRDRVNGAATSNLTGGLEVLFQ